MFPSAHFFGVVYSESLFLLTLVGAVLALRQRRWGWAALSGMAMTATRVNGVMLVPGLLVIAWLSAKPDRTDRLQALAAAAAASVGWLAFCVYAYALSGDPLAWYHSIEQWGYYPGGNPATGLLALAGELFGGPIYFLSTNPMAPYDTLNMLSAVVALALLPLVWRRFNAGYAAIIALGLLLPLSSGQSEGLARVLVGLVPTAPAGRQHGRRHQAHRTAHRFDDGLHAAPGAVRQRPPPLLNAGTAFTASPVGTRRRRPMPGGRESRTTCAPGVSSRDRFVERFGDFLLTDRHIAVLFGRPELAIAVINFGQRTPAQDLVRHRQALPDRMIHVVVPEAPRPSRQQQI